MISSESAAQLVKLASSHPEPVTRAEAAALLIRNGLPVGPRAIVIAARHQSTDIENERRRVAAALLLAE
jgi:hypothetical protein